MRDAFAVLFFVATGMLLDPARLLPGALLALATLGVVLGQRSPSPDAYALAVSH